MIINYIKTAFRFISRQKIYTFINVAGLSIGLSTCLFITLYILDEFRYDAFHKDAKRIYRVNLYGKLSEQDFYTCYTAAPIAQGMKSEIPEIEETCRIAVWNDINVKYEDIVFTEKKILIADSNYFDFFSFRLLQGDPKNVLKGPNGIVLTESLAGRLFGYTGKGDNRPIGKSLMVGTDKRVFRITGITEDPPHNAHFHYSMILPMDSWEYSRNPLWISNALNTYVKLHSNTNWLNVQDKFPDLVIKYVGPQVQMALGIPIEDFLSQGGAYGYTLQPLLKIHLYSSLDQEIEPGGNINTIYILITIVIFVLIIACINFMNLSTARFSGRAREVGVRKTMGASKGLLVFQFLNESFMLTCFSFILALVVITLFINQFNTLSGKQLTFGILYRWDFLASVVVFLLIVGTIAGSYPAFYLSSFKPVEVLKGRIKAGTASGRIRGTLVVLQFFISMVLIISTLLIFKQLKHLEQKDLGFDKGNVLVIKNADALGSRKVSFKEELKKTSDVVNASIVSLAPPDMNYSDVFRPVGDIEQDFGFNYVFADEDLQETLGLKMAAGRYFSRDFPSDSSAIIINEAAVKLIGWKDAVGEKMETHWADSIQRKIIGVVKDFNFQTLKKEISSLAIFPGSDGNNLLVRLAPGDLFKSISRIEDKWKSFASEAPFEYSFLDEDYHAKFRKEQQLAKVFMLFTILAIFIACLGLMGLAAFTAEQRQKEMGIRKAMGASLAAIIRTMSKEYFRLIAISLVLSIPASYLIITWWLKSFAYRTQIGVMSFVYGALVAILATVISVAYQSVKAATKAPVESLKYE
jgi:putative ABC transport system permease protein